MSRSQKDNTIVEEDAKGLERNRAFVARTVRRGLGLSTSGLIREAPIDLFFRGVPRYSDTSILPPERKIDWEAIQRAEDDALLETLEDEEG